MQSRNGLHVGVVGIVSLLRAHRIGADDSGRMAAADMTNVFASAMKIPLQESDKKT